MEVDQTLQPQLAADIRREYEQAEAAFETAVQHAVRCGELLIEAKAQAKHGEWLPWLKENFPASTRTAQGYMRLAARAEDAQGLAHLGIEGALRQLAAPAPEPSTAGTLSRAESDRLADLEGEVHKGLAKLDNELPRLYRHRVHEALGYESWEAFTEAEFSFPADHAIGEFLRDQLRVIPRAPLNDYRLGLIGDVRLAEVREVAEATGCHLLIEDLTESEDPTIDRVWIGYWGPEGADESWGSMLTCHRGWVHYCMLMGCPISTSLLRNFPDLALPDDMILPNRKDDHQE